VPEDNEELSRTSSLRIGVDFGTSTIQVATYVEGREPQLLRLEDATDYMPSYYAKDGAGLDRFGVEAVNLAENYHSIKPLLVDDIAIDGVGHPSQIAFLMLEEVVRRTIVQLRAQRLIPEVLETLEIATNLGCTPRFELDTRIRLRDVAKRAGLGVTLATLVEEPVAAASEIMLSGVVSDGRVLVIDMGGGTLDIAVIKISGAAQSFELFASAGYPHAGDAFTDIIVARIQSAVSKSSDAPLTRADMTLIWQRAEAAKQTLSVRRSALIPLGGIAGRGDETIEFTSEWFEGETRRLRVFVEHDVRTAYQLARLVLDRGGPFDPAPGTVDFDEPTKGRVRRLTEIGLRDDALEHIDSVVLVGGATNMPMVRKLFADIFGDRLIEPEIVGIDRSAIVALGLSRPKPPGMTNLRFPNWGVSAEFESGYGRTEVAVYEPFAPTFQIQGGYTSVYSYSVALPGCEQSVPDLPANRWQRLPVARSDLACRIAPPDV
jgi:molecular chaperone DnaK (HSP70)